MRVLLCVCFTTRCLLYVQCFTLKFHSQFGETISFGTYVDGQWIQGQLVDSKIEVKGADQDATSYRPFMFGAIRLSGVPLIALVHGTDFEATKMMTL